MTNSTLDEMLNKIFEDRLTSDIKSAFEAQNLKNLI